MLLNFDDSSQTIIIRGPIGRWVAGTHLVEGDSLVAESPELSLKAYEGRVFDLIIGEKRDTSI